MKIHTVNEEALKEWQLTEKVLFASSSREDKQLYCTLTGGYEVWHKKELILETILSFRAVDKYNSINEKQTL